MYMKKTSAGIRSIFLALILLQAAVAVSIATNSNPVSALTEDSTLQQPTNICGESGISSVDLSWDTPTDINVTGHVVEYQTYGAASWTAGPEVTEVNRVTVPGVNGTRYKYRVASTDDSGNRSAWGSYCLMGWGRGYSSSGPVQISNSEEALAGKTVAKVAVGGEHSCAVTVDGVVACWGDNGYGELGNGTNGSTQFSVTPFSVTGGALAGKTVTNITAGQYHTCAVTSDGTAACWGNNGNGQLGNGTTINSNTPVAVTMSGALTGKTVTDITAGGGHTCAVTSDGTAACWGNNFGGQLGDGTTTDSSTPISVTGGALTNKTVTDITAGGGHTCALISDGTVTCWGWNDNGQLGDGTTTDSSTPISVTGGALTNKTVNDITASLRHTCALLSDGTAACWGWNQFGQLGDGTTTDSSTPVALTSGATFTSITAGWTYTCVVFDDGSASCWGHTYYGQGNVYGGALAGKAVSSISASRDHACLVTTDGIVACVGANSLGQLGNASRTNSIIPVAVTADALTGKTVSSVAVAGNHSCAVLSDGAAACWGQNPSGELGNGTTNSSSTPVTVTGGALIAKKVISITAGGSFFYQNIYRGHTCAVLSEGTAACWGWNEFGQLGSGSTSNSTIPVAVTGGALTDKIVTSIAASSSHTCAVLSDGSVACWGSNRSGQLGNGTTTNSTIPVAVTGDALTGKTVTKLAVSDARTCAVLSDGSVACWGVVDILSNGNGDSVMSATPVAITGGALAGKTVTSITNGGGHTCAVLSDGMAACWGSNWYGTLGNGTWLGYGSNSSNYSNTPAPVASNGVIAGKTVTSVTASQYHTCAVLSDGMAACWGDNYYGELGDGSTTLSTTPVSVTGGGYTSIATGLDDVVGVSDGTFVVGESPLNPFYVEASAVGGVVTATWMAPVRSGAGPVTGYRSEYSYDAGRTWSAGSDWSAGMSSSFSVSRDGYVRVRVQAKNAAAESLWTVAAQEVLITTALSVPSVTKSNVTVTFQTPTGDPVVGSSIRWQTVDGKKRGVNAVVTGSDGAAKFSIINTGPVIFTLSGGRVGTSATQISSASLTDVIAKSGTSITVTLPLTPSVVRRTITTSMPDGAPVPGVALSISGGVSGSTSTGVTTNLRSFTTSWSYDGWIGNNTTADANGALTFSGFQVPSVGRDVIATFSDGEIEQDASGSLTSATTDLVFDQMPVVQMIVDTQTYFEPGSPVTVTVIAVDGTGDPISDTSINLAAVTSNASALSTAFLNAAELHPNAVSCTQKLSAKTKANGRVTLTLCPTTTKAWRADGTNIVASKPSTVRVKSAPGAPKVSTVTASAGKLTVAFTKPSSNGGATIKNYEYSTNNGRTWKAFSPADTSTPLVITRRSDTTGSLVKGTTYIVRIRAINSKGKGTASASKTITAK
jgi:alpha-tubulin suppressor-like RCC1 family protein